MNPLLDIQFRVPFDKIEASDVEPAIDQLLADANARLEATIASERPLHALDTMTEKLDYAASGKRRHDAGAARGA
jgi:oligopeptidase A